MPNQEMVTLTYNEQLRFREAQNYPLKDNPEALANYLVKRLYGMKLGDFPHIKKVFRIESKLAILEVGETDSKLTATNPQFNDLIKNFCEVKDLAIRLRKSLKNIKPTI